MTMRHALVRFAFWSLPIQIPGYAYAQIFAMTNQLHILIYIMFSR